MWRTNDNYYTNVAKATQRPFFGQQLISYRKYILQIMQPSQYWYPRGTLVWQVLEEGRLSTCKLYVYIINIQSATLWVESECREFHFAENVEAPVPPVVYHGAVEAFGGLQPQVRNSLFDFIHLHIIYFHFYLVLTLKINNAEQIKGGRGQEKYFNVHVFHQIHCFPFIGQKIN